MPPIIASVSGGKDSTALCLWLQEQGLEYRAVHMDTGWEAPETDRYLREYLPQYIGPISWIYPPRGMAELIRWKRSFPGRIGRFCTEQLKIFPLMQWMDAEYPVVQLFNAVGIRAEESPSRAQMTEYQDVGWAITWRPLLDWKMQDVVDIHKRHGVLPNPLYLAGASRVGCWPCIFARKSEIRLVADADFKRILEIRDLEREVRELRGAAYAQAGDTFESLGRVAPTFFNRRALGSGNPTMMPIDQVVEWAQTARGGRQFELFHEVDRSGCMAWGLCDA